MMDREEAVHALIDAIDRALAPHAGAGIVEVRAGLAQFGHGPMSDIPSHPQPDCGYLDEALSAAGRAGAPVSALEAARPYLKWITYDGYPPDEIGPHFPKAHAFATIIGPAGPVRAPDFELGLFLIAPYTLYRDHHHPAPELYLPLTGPHRWRFGVDANWLELPADRPVWNEPWAAHATLVGPLPFLCIYSWTRDVDLPAKLVFANDWLRIETILNSEGSRRTG
jgi:hypothetical protein